MNMKRLFAILFLAAGISYLSAGAFLHYFHAKSDGENVVLTWETADENNVQQFIVMRGMDRDTMVDIAIVNPKGDNSSYKFTDESAYKTEDSFYAYQLKIRDKDGSETFSSVVSVSHQPSSVKRTWGSIKALFR